MSGPAKTPTAVLEQRGSWRGKERSGKTKHHDGRDRKEPPNVESKITMPSILKGEAAKEWTRQIKRLRAQRLFSETYRNSLAVFCQAWGLFFEASQKLNELGPEQRYDPEDGSPLQPFTRLIKVIDLQFARMEKIGKEFGWTPARKADLVIVNSPPEKGDGKQSSVDPEDPERFFETPSVIPIGKQA